MRFQLFQLHNLKILKNSNYFHQNVTNVKKFLRKFKNLNFQFLFNFHLNFRFEINFKFQIYKYLNIYPHKCFLNIKF